MPEKQPWRDEGTLRRMYLDEEMSTYEIGDSLGCSRVTVSNWLERFGIDRRGRKPDDCHLQDGGLAEELYVQRELSLSSVAEEVGCSIWKVRYWLDRHGIETGKPGESHFAVEKLTDDEWLYERYIDDGSTTIEIANQLDCTARTVTEWLHKHDIDCPWRLPEVVRDQLCDEERMRDLYESEGLTTFEIADELDYSAGYVNEWLLEHGITDGEMTGESHPSWTGGEYAYGEGWCTGKREAVRERDGYRCRFCGMENAEHEERHGIKLHVHHVRKARNVADETERNAPENLVTLCASCHVEAERMAPELPEEIDE